MSQKIKIISLFLAGIVVIIGMIFVLLVPSNNVGARQGCCSYHGGVCGCHCCDGTSLSAKCAPYYPHCYSQKTIQPSSPKLPELPTLPETPGPEVQKFEQPSSKTFTADVSEESGGINWWWIILPFGLLILIIYIIKKRK